MGPQTKAAIEAAMGVEAPLVAMRRARGCRCFAAWKEAAAAGYGWVSSGPEWIGELGLEIRPPAGEAYVWNCVTLPPHRRQGIFRSLLIQVVATAREEGISRLWIGSVDGVGDPAVLQAGFVPVLSFRVITLGGWRWLGVQAASNATPELVAAARASLGAGRPLRSGIRRVPVRRAH
jgi:GNAT superfamily N-acetyltransferase